MWYNSIINMLVFMPVIMIVHMVMHQIYPIVIPLQVLCFFYFFVFYILFYLYLEPVTSLMYVDVENDGRSQFMWDKCICRKQGPQIADLVCGWFSCFLRIQFKEWKKQSVCVPYKNLRILQMIVNNKNWITDRITRRTQFNIKYEQKNAKYIF